MELSERAEIHDLLRGARVIAIVGYSDDPNKPSYGIARYLMSAGYTVYLVNPHVEPDGEYRVYDALAEVPEAIDIVDVFRRPDALPAHVDEAIAIGAKAVWAQLGISNPEAAAKANAAGMPIVQDRCIRTEHRRMQMG